MPEEEIKTSSQNTGGGGTESSNSKKKKNKKRKKQPPQPGDPDYKTPTQLRNARKRRKKKQDKANSNSNLPNSTAGKETTGATSLPYGSINDPSLKYLSNPKAAPTVRNAIKFFREKTNAQAGTNHDEYFPVICGPKLGWRTVARLAVKNNPQQKQQEKQNQLRIGLFVPGSHELLPVPDCPVHHRKINGLVKVLEETCNSLGVQAMDDDGNNGDNNNNDSFGLRYIAIAVERTTKKQQLVLVWKEASENNDDKNNNNAIIDKLIQELVKLSRDKTKQDIRLQSVWVHYNNTWKHSNSIFDRQGRWETKFVDGKKNSDGNDEDNDPLYGSIRECMLPLAPKKNKDGKIIPKTTSPLEKIHVPLFFPPQVFRQANLDGFAKIILRIREWLHEQQLKEPAALVSLDTQERDEKGQQEQVQPKRKRRRGKRDTSTNNKEEKVNDSKISPSTTTNAGTLKSLGHCLELYGGVGTIGLNLVDFFDSLDSSDENPFNEICFHASADRMKVVTNDQKSLLDPSKRSKITYTSKSASDICVEQYDSLKKARVVVVDPPRKGLDAPVVEALCSDYGESSELVQHLVYVSCGFDAFRRDYRALVEHSGKWTLDKAEGHILFPGSDAIETLAFFTRTKE